MFNKNGYPKRRKEVFAIIIGTLLIFFLMSVIIITDDCCMCGASSGCCPCPNSEYMEEVSEYHGYRPSSAGSWAGMCNMYKEANNLTFDCFI